MKYQRKKNAYQAFIKMSLKIYKKYKAEKTKKAVPRYMLGLKKNNNSGIP